MHGQVQWCFHLYWIIPYRTQWNHYVRAQLETSNSTRSVSRLSLLRLIRIWTLPGAQLGGVATLLSHPQILPQVMTVCQWLQCGGSGSWKNMYNTTHSGPHRIKTRFLYTEVPFLSLALNKNITLHYILISILFELCVRYKCFGNTKMNIPIGPGLSEWSVWCACMHAWAWKTIGESSGCSPRNVQKLDSSWGHFGAVAEL